MTARSVLAATLLTLASAVSARTSADTVVNASGISPSEISVVINSTGLQDGPGTTSVLRACRALVGGDSRRILDAGKAHESQLAKPLTVDEPESQEATIKARWLREWLSTRVRPGETIVLVGDERYLPTWYVRLGSVNCTTDSFYTDLDGDGVPETAVSRIVGDPDIMIRQIEGKQDYGQKATILCSEDTRIHLETQAFAKQLSHLGYTVEICGARSDQILTESDVIVHFGHGGPSRISNRFGETFVSARAMPKLARSPIVFADGCGTLPIGSPLLRTFLEQGALAYLGSTEAVQGMIPARFTNELVEHFLRIMKQEPGSTLPHALTAARAAYVRGHPGLAGRLRTLALTGAVEADGNEVIDLLTTSEWVYYGDPQAVLQQAGTAKELCREVLSLSESVRLDEVNRSWQCSFVSRVDDGQAVLAIYADIPLSERTSFSLSVHDNQRHIAVLDSHDDTRYYLIGQDCRGGYVCGESYRARFLVPLGSFAGKHDVEVTLESGASIDLTSGTVIDIWPTFFEKLIGLKQGPDMTMIRQARKPSSQESVKAVGKAQVRPTDRPGFLSLDLSLLFNRPHNSIQVGGGDNASFGTWFTENGITADGVPFHIRRSGNDVLVSANNTENVYEIQGLKARAGRLHFLLWGYNNPSQPARLRIGFEDGSFQEADLPLSEWTEAPSPVAFDLKNTIPVFRHAAITHEIIEVSGPAKEIVSMSSLSGTYGLIAVTFEE